MSLQHLGDKAARVTAAIALTVMVLLSFGAMRGDSAIMDEGPHISAGYSYLAFQDMRLNPEHPPFIKALAAIPLQFLNLNFPTDHKAWREDINGQWDIGPEFFYRSGNDADRLIFWARIPMLLVLLTLGIFLFHIARRYYGNVVATFSTVLFSFSPVFIAHGHYVTTDVAAALGFLIGTYYFLRYLKLRTWKSLVAAGIAFGAAELMKFSLVLLVPLFIFLVVAKLVVERVSKKESWRLLRDTVLIFTIGIVLVVWPVYMVLTANYPLDRQHADTESLLSSFTPRILVNTVVWMSDKPILHSLGEYGLGVLMVAQRASGGNTTYFLGEVDNLGWRHYFPVVYLIKEPLALHVFTVLSLIFAVLLWRRAAAEKRLSSFGRISEVVRDNFHTFAFLAMIGMYWAYSIQSTLNIGVRHILPTLPFIYMLVARGTVRWAAVFGELPLTLHPIKLLRGALSNSIKVLAKASVVLILLIWYVLSTTIAYPFFLAYFNELAGGSANGHKYVVDSNLDWGQDLRRLTDYVESQNINEIKVDYFGGGSPEYYLGDKFIPWWASRGEAPGWIAVSASFRQGSIGKLAPHLKNDERTNYTWLLKYEPKTVIGNSIFVYDIPKQTN